MPSKSKKQHDFMAAIAHSEKFSKKVEVPMSVGKDFMEADGGKKLGNTSWYRYAKNSSWQRSSS